MNRRPSSPNRLFDRIVTIAYTSGCSMMHRPLAILMFGVTFAWSQQAQPSIRVEVKSGDVPIQSAEVAVNGHSGRTGSDGVAIVPAPLGRIDITVTKDRYFPARATMDIDSAKEWAVQIELQPQKDREETITVYATRNDVRVQDSTLHVEVV